MILERALGSDALGLMRVTVAEARQFPDLASSVQRMARERGRESIAQLLGEFAKSDEMGALPAFAPDHLPVTARVFADLILLPMIMGGLFGEDLEALRSEIGPHVSQSVPFFLAACRYEGDPIGPDPSRPHHETAGCGDMSSNPFLLGGQRSRETGSRVHRDCQRITASFRRAA